MKNKIFTSRLISCFCVLTLMFGVFCGFGLTAKATGYDSQAVMSGVSTHNSTNNVMLASDVTESEKTVIQSYVLTATVEGDTSNKTVSYSVKYKDGTTPSASVCTYEVVDGKLHIDFYERFNKQIVVTAYSNANRKCTATCTIDCNKVRLGFGNYFVNDYAVCCNGDENFICPEPLTLEDEFNLALTYKYLGTVGEEFVGLTPHYTLELTSEAIEALSDFSDGLNYNLTDLFEFSTVYTALDEFCNFNVNNEYSVISALKDVEYIFDFWIEGENYDDDGNSVFFSYPHLKIGGFDFSEYLESHTAEEFE